jgi:hypothetical protein
MGLSVLSEQGFKQGAEHIGVNEYEVTGRDSDLQDGGVYVVLGDLDGHLSTAVELHQSAA